MTRRDQAHVDDPGLTLDDAEARLDELLDAALAPDAPPPYLLEQIVERTLPQVERRAAWRPPVLARLGSPLLKAAAVIAVVGTVVIALLNAPAGQWELPAPGAAADPPASMDQIERQLAWIGSAAEPLDAEIDQHLDLLALQVEVVQHDPLWYEHAGWVDDPVLLLYEIDLYISESSVIF